ncbi:MAG: GNAT family N-acetyltransferase [Candidatus Binataceae bacterium]
MKVVSYSDGHAFWHDVATPLSARPVLSNVFIGVANRIRKDLRKDFIRAGVFDGSELVLGVLRTPPHRLNLAHLGRGEAGVAALVRHLIDAEAAIPGVVAEQALAETFANRWSATTGQRVARRPGHGLTQNLYEVARVAAPTNVAGAMRPARGEERDLILRWEMAFAVDAGLPQVERELEYVTRFVDEGLTDNTFFVWEAHDRPVATARLRPIGTIGARVAGVYTPDDRRGHGFASALTAALSQRVLAAGLWCCLFADADNALTNRIYQRIGYVRLATFADMLFVDA